MKKKTLLFLIVALTILSCKDDKQKLELEQTKVELEKAKIELAEKEGQNVKAELEKNRLEKSIDLQKEKLHEEKLSNGLDKKKALLEKLLNDSYENLESIKEESSKINEFQLGRSQSTKEKQLAENQEKLISATQSVERIKFQLSKLDNSKTFSFQKEPIDLVKYIFKSCNNRDFSNFSYLCDAYAENDGDVNSFCYADLLDEEYKYQLEIGYGKGRIIGSPRISNDIAEVDIEFGPNNEFKETLNLINRNGYWYLYSF